MDVSLVIRHRLKELGLEQKDLAFAADVTESYISQLLARRKAPPAPGRTDIYNKISEYLRLPEGELSKLADLQRREEQKRKVAEPPRPLFEARRAMLLRKCHPDRRREVAAIFGGHPFGELERLVTQKLLEIAQRQESLIQSWDIDLRTFSMEVIMNPQVGPQRTIRFEFSETKQQEPATLEQGLEQFFKDSSLSGDVTEEEAAFLRTLQFRGRRPSALYYYRELQNLRDPLHFHPAAKS